jgi:citrate lyase synthetase
VHQVGSIYKKVIRAWCFLFAACELIHIFVTGTGQQVDQLHDRYKMIRKNTEIIMLKIFDTAVQNLVYRVTMPPEFVHPCHKSCVEVGFCHYGCSKHLFLLQKYLARQDIRDAPTNVLQMFL